MALRLSGLASGMDTDTIIKELMAAQRTKVDKIEQKKTKLEWKQDIWKTLNTKLYSFYTGALSKMKMQGTFKTQTATASDTSKVTVSASTAATAGTHTLKVTQLASAQFVTGAKLDLSTAATTSSTLESLGMEAGTINITVGSAEPTDIAVDSTTTISGLVSKLKEAGINASFDATQQRFFLSSKESGEANAFYINAASTVDLSKLGLASFDDGTLEGSYDMDGSADTDGQGCMTLVTAKDAEFVYNGASMTSSSNSVTVNGLTLNLLGTTGGDTVSISVSKDTQAAYDAIKSFITEYNALITEMNTLYYADSSRGYEPLTDDEREAMTDDQIEKWETKIKDSLLRRDDTVSSLLSTMRTTLSGSATYSGDGKSYSLASFGIVTGVYTERGLLHINGDEDDSTTAGKTNDLMAALEEDPDAVMETLNTLAGNLYTSFSDAMKSTSLSSALTFYNDKDMANRIDEYEDDIAEWEDKLADMEDRYYKQFSAMETALSKLNSQSSSLASLLGTSTS